MSGADGSGCSVGRYLNGARSVTVDDGAHHNLKTRSRLARNPQKIGNVTILLLTRSQYASTSEDVVSGAKPYLWKRSSNVMKPKDLYICRECGHLYQPENELTCPKCESAAFVNLSELTDEQRVKLARAAYVLQ